MFSMIVDAIESMYGEILSIPWRIKIRFINIEEIKAWQQLCYVLVLVVVTLVWTLTHLSIDYRRTGIGNGSCVQYKCTGISEGHPYRANSRVKVLKMTMAEIFCCIFRTH